MATPMEQQQLALQDTILETVLLEDEEMAEEFFVVVKDRLLDVNSWNRMARDIPVRFALTDDKGKELHAHLHNGHIIQVNTGADIAYRLHVDAIVYDDYPDTHTEAITVILSLDDRLKDLSVQRQGARVSCSVHIRGAQGAAVPGNTLLPWSALVKAFTATDDEA